MMSSSDKSLLKEIYLYKLKCVNRWFINIIVVHLIFSVISVSFGGFYFSGGDINIEVQQVIYYAELIFASVCAMITTGFCLVDKDFRWISFSVPTTRKIESFSNLAIIGTIAVFTTVSTLMIENLKILLSYYGKVNYDSFYIIANIDYKIILESGVKIFLGLILTGLVGYVFSLLRKYHKRGLCIGIVVFILGMIVLGYLGYEVAIINFIVEVFTSLGILKFGILLVGISIVLVFSAYKIVEKGDVC